LSTPYSKSRAELDAAPAKASLVQHEGSTRAAYALQTIQLVLSLGGHLRWGRRSLKGCRKPRIQQVKRGLSSGCSEKQDYRVEWEIVWAVPGSS